MKPRLWLISLSVIASSTAFANIFEAEKLYSNKHYEASHQHYLEAAAIGNPRAYYKLANMYSKGTGVEQDTAQSLVYYALAAEQGFHDAQTLLNNALATLDPATKDEVAMSLQRHLESNGATAISSKYYPTLKQTALEKKISFGKNTTVARYEEEGETRSQRLSRDHLVSIQLWNGNDDALFVTPPPMPFAVLDVDVNPDGSVRHYTTVQSFGVDAQDLIDDFLQFPKREPRFQNQGTNFVHRVYLGSANYTKYKLRDDNAPLWKQVRKVSSKAKRAESLHERYLAAVAKLNFKAIAVDKTEAEHELQVLAQLGHPGAMYEYGMRLYRQQKDIPQAVQWISEASKYGLARAEYRLGRLLMDSPWIEKDEAKALFWLERAMQNNHEDAALRAAAIKLSGSNTALRDIDGATDYLAAIKGSLSNHPEYNYYRALSYKDGSNKDYTKSVAYLKKAISAGRQKRWDVSEWEGLLSELTTGTVSSCEYNVAEGDTCNI